MSDLTSGQSAQPEMERLLQSELDKINEEDPPAHEIPWLLGIFRHKCSAQFNRSKAISLKEIYIKDSTGDFAILAREGKCRKCGEVARTKQGHIVHTSERPPISGRVARD